VDCRHYDTDPHRALLHRGPAETVHVYDEGCALVEAYLRTAFWDKAPNWIGTDPADLERPYVEVTVPTDSALLLSLSPDQARAFAAALLRAADTTDRAHTTTTAHLTKAAARLDHGRRCAGRGRLDRRAEVGVDRRGCPGIPRE
jgi:hypothetical protein